MPSTNAFDHAIAPIPRETFFAEYFEAKPLIVSRGAPGYFDDLLSFADIDRVVSTMGLGPPEVSLAGAGNGAAADSDAGRMQPGDYTDAAGRADPVRIAQHVADGATLILNSLQDRLPALGQYTRALEQVLSARVQTNIYLTPPGKQGFQPHYDNHDVLVLQIAGRKEWRLYDTPVALPLQSQGFSADRVEIGPESARFVMEPGDTAYIPRGLAHDAAAVDGTSLHITTGLMFRTWADLLVETVRHTAEADPAFRRALPPGFATTPPEVEATRADLMARLADGPNAAKMLQSFAAAFIAERAPRVEGQLAQALHAGDTDIGTIAGVRPGLIWALTPDDQNGTVRLDCEGAEIILPAHTETALRHALTEPRFTVADLPGDLDDDGKCVLVRRLIREGFVRRL